MVVGWVGVINATQLYYYLLWLSGGWVSLILPNCIIIIIWIVYNYKAPRHNYKPATWLVDFLDQNQQEVWQ